ncbi:hypothetical protein BCR41DRAFT_423013 [Lobosporangium transversale]|uniref:Uncharacterized protein n=1 Tax=Lobosporangium transversale TaxID=64571 RepID=A0A1Y2G0D3_9FUNG|nr:hypothetical protein BCR41DRAFT_427117 [Lobosporangium transversale]XP_021880281.1 hypothetical protein BCR41DRAFT_423013 [Lobosporangium transversale]ORY88910.1 hypothetical protein BCR41DRAFT_427117 [Lobosporangium transversale]ORZ12932.1 hypothetical protein BCR41DRAFT_423013 [Lobosporangium transversale]|eukprot:XP_021875018.1 hypothetical protein BCR41DRAFT_427117 [Lobosporangium transversale]
MVRAQTHLRRLREEPTTIEILRKRLAAISLELADAKDDLEISQAQLEGTLSCLSETQLELKNTKDALANSERARLEANRDRVLSRPYGKQEVFAILKFRQPQPLPIGGYRLFALQRKAVDRTLDQFIADNPDLDPVEIAELRSDRSPRGENVYLQMKDDVAAPIDFSRRNFVLKDSKAEEEMIVYVQKVFNTHTQEK